MGHLIKVEQFDQGNTLEASREFSVSGWEGIWQAVKDEMDRTGKIPNDMQGWGEYGCGLSEGHDCEKQPAVCEKHLREAIQDWIRSAWENNELKTGSFYFSGAAWSAVTFGWDGN